MKERVFKSGEEVRQQLISFHSVDWEADSDINEMTLEDMLEHGQWELEEVCELCEGKEKIEVIPDSAKPDSSTISACLCTVE